ncbi:MAG: hypothetical protein PUE01_13575 [Clostridiaceae bacterium]|nr:hypothetical protein [Clostridiaceae bacterium]
MKDNVLEQVENLSALLEETAAGSEEVTASAEEANASTAECVEGFKKLNKISEELAGEVNKFKY